MELTSPDELPRGELFPDGVSLAPGALRAQDILTPDALRFLALLERRFRDRRGALLERRGKRQEDFDAGVLPDFLEETRDVREGSWTVAPIPPDLLDRRVEITGPTDRKMIINALNSGASVFMADFEDANSPTWSNLIDGQRNVRDAVAREITFVAPGGKAYRLKERTATLVVRPRGWHLPERHLLVDGRPVSGSLFDFGLFFFHNARALMKRGTGPYLYLPKLESHLEARLWNDVFLAAQEALGIPSGTIRATVLVETIVAAFEMHEILWELREHSAGLNCGRWDYIFSFIKKFQNHPGFVLPDRALVTMEQPFLRSYSLLLIETCHRRGIHAMGGMAAQIPIAADPEANRIALEQVAADKRREVQAGHDGTWVAHPALVPIAREIFDSGMPGPNQIGRAPGTAAPTAGDLVRVPRGAITEAGIRENLRVGIQYLEAWLRGAGCVPIDHRMEDAATAEISRSQLWQWLRHGVTLEDGRTLTLPLYEEIRDDELTRLSRRIGTTGPPDRPFGPAARLFDRLVTSRKLEEFLTIPAYEELEA